MHRVSETSPESAVSFRTPMAVTAVRSYKTRTGSTTFPVCPRCGITMEHEYQSYCDRCGQALNWRRFSKAKVIF